MAKGNDELKEHSELQKARGETPSQKELRAYQEGDFQTTDPITGEPRGETGGTWQDEDTQTFPIGEETSPEDLKAQQKEEIARSAGSESAARPVRKSSAKKGKRGR